MKSLLIMAFGRSMSSFIARTAAQSLSTTHKYTTQVGSGEVLLGWNMGSKYTGSYEQNVENFPVYKEYLDRYSEEPWIIKDVHEPFVCKWYTDIYPDRFNVLFIRRSLQDIIYRHFLAQWWWPILALPEQRDIYDICWNQTTLSEYHFAHGLPALVRGVVQTNRACYQELEHKIYWNKLIYNPGELWNTLEDLGYSPVRHNYIDDGFVQKREAVLAYRQRPLWRMIDGLLQEIREEFK